MTFKFNDFDAEIQCDEFVDERISDEDLEAAGEFYDELEIQLDAMDGMLDWDEVNAELNAEIELSDDDWNERREDYDEELH